MDTSTHPAFPADTPQWATILHQQMLRIEQQQQTLLGMLDRLVPDIPDDAGE